MFKDELDHKHDSDESKSDADEIVRSPHNRGPSHAAGHRGSLYIHGALLQRDSEARDDQFESPWERYEPPKTGIASVASKMGSLFNVLTNRKSSNPGSPRSPRTPRQSHRPPTAAEKQAMQVAFDTLTAIAAKTSELAQKHKDKTSRKPNGADKPSLQSVVPMGDFLVFYQILAIYRYVHAVGPPPSDDIQAHVADAFADLHKKLGAKAGLGPGWDFAGEQKGSVDFKNRRFQLKKLRIPRTLFEAALQDFLDEHPESVIVDTLHGVTRQLCNEHGLTVPEKPQVEEAVDKQTAPPSVQSTPAHSRTPSAAAIQTLRTFRTATATSNLQTTVEEAEEEQEAAASQIKVPKFMEDGAYFVKHGRLGLPKEKFVCCSATHIVWAEDPEWADDRRINPPPGSSVVLEEITDVVHGKSTKVFKRSTASSSHPSHCFSIISEKRTLDLEAQTPEDARKWVQGLSDILYGASDDDLSVRDGL